MTTHDRFDVLLDALSARLVHLRRLLRVPQRQEDVAEVKPHLYTEEEKG